MRSDANDPSPVRGPRFRGASMFRSMALFSCVKYFALLVAIIFIGNFWGAFLTLMLCDENSMTICIASYLSFLENAFLVASAPVLAFGSAVLLLLCCRVLYLSLLSKKHQSLGQGYVQLGEIFVESGPSADPGPENPLKNTTFGKVALVTMLVESIIRGKHEANVSDEIVNLFLTFSEPLELLHFKNSLDRVLRKFEWSLYSLVYNFMGITQRTKILNHFEELFRLGETDTHIQEKFRRERRAFIVSDMDDTLVSTFKDQRFPFNTRYPGVRQFFHELIYACSSVEERVSLSEWSNAKHQVSFITARPNWLNAWTKRDLQRHGFDTSVALTGTPVSFLTPSSILERKVSQFHAMKRLYPEGIFFLVGDNGQWDIDLGKRLLNDGLAQAVFIHDIFRPVSAGNPKLVAIQDVADFTLDPDASSHHRATDITEYPIDASVNPRSIGSLDTESVLHRVWPSIPTGFRKTECVENGIVLFRSYAGAALAAMQLELFDIQSLLNVALACAEDLANVSFTHPIQQHQQRDVLLHDVAHICQTISYETEVVKFLNEIFTKIDVH